MLRCMKFYRLPVCIFAITATKKRDIIGVAALLCMMASAGIVSASPAQSNASFTDEMVSGRSMVSSGYGTGTVTFNPDGSLTCTGYPAVIVCKTWNLDSDGTIVRYFEDNSGKEPKVVRAVWRLVKNNELSFEVNQTSNNSDKTTAIRVSYR